MSRTRRLPYDGDFPILLRFGNRESRRPCITDRRPQRGICPLPSIHHHHHPPPARLKQGNPLFIIPSHDNIQLFTTLLVETLSRNRDHLIIAGQYRLLYLQQQQLIVLAAGPHVNRNCFSFQRDCIDTGTQSTTNLCLSRQRAYCRVSRILPHSAGCRTARALAFSSEGSSARVSTIRPTDRNLQPIHADFYIPFESDNFAEYHNAPIGEFIAAAYIRQTPTVFPSRTSYFCIGMIAHR